jgi:hypothetical protein
LARAGAAVSIFNGGSIQMTSISDVTAPLPLLRNSIVVKFLAAAAMAAFADWLFYDHRVGLSLALFLLVLSAISVLANPVQANRRNILLAGAILFAGLAPIVEYFDILSAGFGVAATALAVSALTNPFLETFGDRLQAARRTLFGGPSRLLADLSALQTRSLSLTAIAVWVVPVALSALFMVLFSAANPLIEHWFALIDLRALLAQLNMWRLLFWTAILLAIWPSISAKWKRRKQAEAAAKAETPPATDTAAPSAFFGASAILRSLALFNLLFAVQTILDIVYLWSGVALPEGMTYASYAHRGAYPLILTALLAAAFVLAAMRPGGPAERVSVIRILVFMFVAQNVMLVISSILRLDLYVEVYSLTYLRVAAFIWMILVVLGLILIVGRIVLNRSNGWLVQANLASLTAVLYICAFINFPLVIADYNVSHSREMSGKGVWLDLYYLTNLGPHALPAIDRYLAHPNRLHSNVRDAFGSGQTMDMIRNALVSRHRAESANWRSWSLRSWRLQRYLDSFSTNSRASS